MSPEEREELIMQYFPMAVKMSWRVSKNPDIREDNIQVAMLGVIYAVDNYDPNRGVNLASFVHICIHKAHWKFWANNNTVHVPYHCHYGLSKEELGELKSRTCTSTLPEKFEFAVQTNAFENIVARESVRKMLKVLTDKERIAVKAVHGIDAAEPMDCVQAASLCGVSHQCVNKRVNTAIGKLKRHFCRRNCVE